ncbi:MAG: YoaK family protein [Terriglobia bacterium]
MDKIPLLVAVLLTWVAGFVDAVGFISLGRIYTANMSGNSVSVGIAISSQNWVVLFYRIWPVITYVGGLISCRILLEIGARERIRAIASVAFASEIVLLAPVCILGLPPRPASSELPIAYIALLAFAMGAQNGILTRFSSHTLHTGFVTGTLLKFAEQFTKFLTESFDRFRAGDTLRRALLSTRNEKSFRMSSLLAGMYAAYIIGAVCGGFGDHVFSLKALAAPMVCLLGLIPLDLKRRLASQDEEQQAWISESE